MATNLPKTVLIHEVIEDLDLGTYIHAQDEKTPIVDADEIGFWDSVSLSLKKITWANIKVVLKAYFTAANIDYDGDETVEHILDDTLNSGILHAITVTDEGGINISWTTGSVWDNAAHSVIDTSLHTSTACTDNAVNYLYWDRSGAGTALTLSTVPSSVADDDVCIAIIYTQDGDIWEIDQCSIIGQREVAISAMLGSVVGAVVASGLVVSEHAGANAFDVDMTPGVWWHKGHTSHTVDAFDSTVTNIVRWFHTGGVWDSDASSQIDPTKYDNGTNLVVTTANKYYRSTFFIIDDNLHWIYPRVAYDTIAQAVAADCPIKPTALLGFPSSTCIILKGDASALPTAGGDQWIDIRPMIGAVGSSGTVTSHLNLADIGTNTHAEIDLAIRGVTVFAQETEPADPELNDIWIQI